MHEVAVNARFFAHRPTGMQHYALEVCGRLRDDLSLIRPGRALRGAEGHLWEQGYLPLACRGRLLWSPNNTGPLAVRHQVCTVHDLIPLDRPEWFHPRFSQWYEWLMPKLAARVQHIIAVSEFTKERVVELLRVKPEKVSVVPNGIDERFRIHTAEEIQAARDATGIRSDAYLLYVGSVEPRKNVGRLLQAWARVQNEIPAGLDLVVAGAMGASRVFAEAELGRIPDRVHFPGYIASEHLPALYSGAMAFLYPSLYEGFGLPPLEAMACGIPVLTSRGSSLGEVVGEDAVLIEPESVDSIAEGILRIVQDSRLRAELSVAGPKRASRLTWAESARMTGKVLQEQRQQ